MTPKLPANPMTITPPQLMPRTAEGARNKYYGRRMDANMAAEIRADLQVLRDWDNYERESSLEREAAKRVLRRFLDQEQ